MLSAKYIHINMDKNKRPKFYTLPDTLQTDQHPPPSRSSCAACPASGRLCLALRGLPWYLSRPGSGTACPAACAVQSVRMRWGLGLHWRGIQGAPGVGQVMPAIKFFKEKGVFSVPLANTHPTFTKRNPSDCASLQKFQKIQKDPFWSLDCAIIS